GQEEEPPGHQVLVVVEVLVEVVVVAVLFSPVHVSFAMQRQRELSACVVQFTSSVSSVSTQIMPTSQATGGCGPEPLACMTQPGFTTQFRSSPAAQRVTAERASTRSAANSDHRRMESPLSGSDSI